ncbi:patatin-like phospholipase family protein [Geotalea sp. SG265]|uniref:patatin-like phospholipase family protein n=1 Tax=Geotalea sp. SG265 TaxID=2922867 RepID=UPI001FAED9F0|nr:patatin-like phospholipase family protein [Geotalea sp. SG265]
MIKTSETGVSPETPIALMMVGGGIRFPVFIGALKAIEEKGLRLSKIIGSSTGSIIGALYAAGHTPEQLLRLALETDTRRFKDFSIRSMISNFGLCSGNQLERWVDDRVGRKTFGEELRYPLHIIATDMLSYQPVVFSAEKYASIKIASAATASTVVPWVFGYRRLSANGKKYALVDGSLMSGVVERGLNRNGKTLILKVVSKRTLNHPHHDKVRLRDYFLEMLTFGMHTQEKEFMKGGKWKDTILLYCANIEPAKFALTQHEINFLYSQGYEQTMTYLQYKWGI